MRKCKLIYRPIFVDDDESDDELYNDEDLTPINNNIDNYIGPIEAY